MEMAEVAQKVLTWDEYVRGEPADLERYEIVDGVVIELPAPTCQSINGLLLNMLWRPSAQAGKRMSLVVLVAPCDVVVRREKLRTRQPDLVLIRKERVPDLTQDLCSSRSG